MLRGHQVTVLTTDLKTPQEHLGYSGQHFYEGIPVVYLPSLWARGFFLSPGALPEVLRQLADIELVHIHDTRTSLSWAASRTAMDRGVPYVLTCHGSVNPGIGNWFLKHFHDTIIGKRTVTGASRIIATTKREFRDIENFGVLRRKIDVVPNAVPLYTGNGAKDTEIRAKFGIPDNHKLVLFLGRIHPIKGLDRLIEAFHKVSSNSPLCTLMIAGPDRGASRALKLRVAELGLNKRVVFAGPIFGPDRNEVFSAADVFVLPSLYESFGMTVLEAMATPVPVVTTKACGIADELERFRAALVVSDTDELAEALTRCLNDPRLCGQLMRNATLLLESEYNLEKSVSRLESIYEKVLDDGFSNRI